MTNKYKRIRVVVCVTGSEGYGVQRSVRNQFSMSAKYGIEFEYVCLKRGALYDALSKNGAKIVLIGGSIISISPRNLIKLLFIFLKSIGGTYKAFVGIYKYLKKSHPDIVYSHVYPLHILSGLAAKLLGIKCVGHFRCLMNTRRNYGVSCILLSVTLNYFLDLALAVSNSVKQTHWGGLRKKTHVLYNCVEPQELEGSVSQPEPNIMPDNIDIVCTGRLYAAKKQHLAIEALKNLKDKGVLAKLVIVGGETSEKNAYYMKLRNLIIDYGLEKQVDFTGFLSNPAKIVSRAKISLLCSTIESFGLVTAEAMACKTAVVVADSTGPGEIVENEKTGLKFKPDDADSLAQCLFRLLTDNALRQRLADNAYSKYRSDFSIEAHMTKLREEFDLLLSDDLRRDIKCK